MLKWCGQPSRASLSGHDSERTLRMNQILPRADSGSEPAVYSIRLLDIDQFYMDNMLKWCGQIQTAPYECADIFFSDDRTHVITRE